MSFFLYYLCSFILENLISEDAAFSSGILFGGVRYDVHRFFFSFINNILLYIYIFHFISVFETVLNHRWYESLVIGRNGVAGRGAGICVIKV